MARIIRERGLKKKWVAEQAGMSAAAIALIVNGKTAPTMAAGIRIARVLGVTVEDLWGYLVDGKDEA